MFLRSSRPYRRGEETKERIKREELYTYIAIFLRSTTARESSVIGRIKRKAIIGQDVADVMSLPWDGPVEGCFLGGKKDRNSSQDGRR